MVRTKRSAEHMHVGSEAKNCMHKREKLGININLPSPQAPGRCDTEAIHHILAAATWQDHAATIAHRERAVACSQRGCPFWQESGARGAEACASGCPLGRPQRPKHSQQPGNQACKPLRLDKPAHHHHRGSRSRHQCKNRKANPKPV
jgi:hypothetical protein